MLRWISKSGTFIQFTLYAAVMAVFWIPALVHPGAPVITKADGYFYTLMVSWLVPFPVMTAILALLIVVLLSLFLFYMYQANGFFGRSNFLPAIIVLLAFSWNPSFQTMHAVLPAMLFIIIALNSILSMYGQQGAYHQVFTATFSVSIASLFYAPVACLLLLVWFSLISYRISGWREYAISVIGFLVPYIYFLSWLFWNDNVIQGLTQLHNSIFNLVRPSRIPLIPTIWLSVSAFMLVITMIAILNIMSDKLISLRRRAWVLFNFSFVSLIASLLAGWPILSANYLFIIPLSFFLTGSFVLIKRPFWFEILSVGYFLLLALMRISVLIDL
jgi:hypothetical protein